MLPGCIWDPATLRAWLPPALDHPTISPGAAADMQRQAHIQLLMHCLQQKLATLMSFRASDKLDTDKVIACHVPIGGTSSPQRRAQAPPGKMS